MHSPPGGKSVKIVHNGIVSHYPFRSLVYNAVDSGLAAAEFTFWEWAWLAKNCVKCRLKEGQRGRVVSASDSGSGGRGFDSRPSHVVIALGKQFTLTFPSPPTCKTGTQLQAMSLLYAPAPSCIWIIKWLSNVLVCCGDTVTLSNEDKFPERD